MNVITVITALLPLVVKYGPAIAQFIQNEGPAVQAFIKDVETVFAQIQAQHPAGHQVSNPTEGPNLSGPGFDWTANSGAAKARG